MDETEREALTEVVASLMLSDNFGDVHEAVDRLRDLAGLPPLEGDYLHGWTEADWAGTPSA